MDFSKYTDDDVFNEYWRVYNDIEEHECADYPEWDEAGWQYGQSMIEQLGGELFALRVEARRRGIDLEVWNAFRGSHE